MKSNRALVFGAATIVLVWPIRQYQSSWRHDDLCYFPFKYRYYNIPSSRRHDNRIRLDSRHHFSLFLSSSSLNKSTTFTSPIAFNDTDISSPKPESAVEYYCASSVALTLDGYNNTGALDDEGTPDASLLSNIDVNSTIGTAVPLVDGAGARWSSPHTGNSSRFGNLVAGLDLTRRFHVLQHSRLYQTSLHINIRTSSSAYKTPNIS
ncbi:hypothetical protein C8J56DRAFT_790456 [Mycena floridula]|nr:hypothetical protein C8J56DRAFT_790456 [Mycena floridula]